MGKAHYYATWVLKSNNAPESEWRPFAERARQLFRYLAEWENPQELRHYEQRVREQFDKAVQRHFLQRTHDGRRADMISRPLRRTAAWVSIGLGTAHGPYRGGRGSHRT